MSKQNFTIVFTGSYWLHLEAEKSNFLNCKLWLIFLLAFFVMDQLISSAHNDGNKTWNMWQTTSQLIRFTVILTYVNFQVHLRMRCWYIKCYSWLNNSIPFISCEHAISEKITSWVEINELNIKIFYNESPKSGS